MYCIIVKTQLNEGARDQFMEAMLENAAASVREEPLCHVFDVIEDRDTPNLVYLYEIYESQEALAAHKETAHYKASRAVVNPLIAEQSVIRADVTAMNPRR